MGRSALLFVELDDGPVSGTALGYDEGVKVIGDVLVRHSYQAVFEAVKWGQQLGGVRDVTKAQIETYSDRGCRSVFHLSDAQSSNRGYLKRLDGGVDIVIDGTCIELKPAPHQNMIVAKPPTSRAPSHEADAWIQQSWMGKRVIQMRSAACEFDKQCGRTSTVIETFFDEKGALHCKTEDGHWCPAALYDIIP